MRTLPINVDTQFLSSDLPLFAGTLKFGIQVWIAPLAGNRLCI